MSSVDPFVKETFNAYSFSSDDANQTCLLAIRLAEKINIQNSLITISIVGGVADGKSTMAKALARHILKEADYELHSKLIGRSEPAWRIQSNFNDKVMVRHLDMAAIDMFEDPIMPSLQPRTLDIIEHAKHWQQEQSAIVIDMQTVSETDDGDNRLLINIYTNKRHYPTSMKF